MKEGWPHAAVEEFADLCLGKMLDKAKNKGTLRPYLRNLNVRWFDFDLRDVLEMRVEDKEMERYTARSGDLLVCEGGYPGRAAIWTGLPICFQKAIHRVRCREPERNKWLLYYLHYCDLNGSLKNHFSGTGIQHFTGKAFRKLRVPLPPLSESERIVAILDEAFEGIDTAIANTEQNLANARALFSSYLIGLFEQSRALRITEERHSLGSVESDRGSSPIRVSSSPSVTRLTKTGGRAATTQHIPGPLSLSVGMPDIEPREGWRWSALTSLARMESGHTPSRRHPEYWGGDIPWIGLKDAKTAHGGVITSTLQSTNDLGIQNSSARVLPRDTVCLSRTASVGYVVVTGAPMATSQDFVNWVCSPDLDPHFLRLLFLAQGSEIFRFSSGAVHQTIYFPEAKAFHICHPDVREQRRIVQQADEIASGADELASRYISKLQMLAELKRSILNKAFTGELTASPEAAVNGTAAQAVA